MAMSRLSIGFSKSTAPRVPGWLGQWSTIAHSTEVSTSIAPTIPGTMVPGMTKISTTTSSAPMTKTMVASYPESAAM